MSDIEPIEWVVNRRARTIATSEIVDEIFPPLVFHHTRNFHRQIPGYRISPLKGLATLAARLGLGGIWVKDESARLDLKSFKILGGSFAIYRIITSRLGLDGAGLSFDELMSPQIRAKLGRLTFATATDGNHGRGVAWAATRFGCRAIIYVHRDTSQARIKAIKDTGAEVKVIDGTYDDAVRQVIVDAQIHGWEVVSDTSWPGYVEMPSWVMQGYTTLLSEAQEQLAAQGIVKPTHIFVQAGVGALAASAIGFYHQVLGPNRPVSVVVEPTNAACLFRSAQIGDGQPHSFPGKLQTIMAGLACGDPSPIAWKVLWDCADVFSVCPDYVAAKGMRVYAVPLAEDPFIVSGESGAVTLGALMFIAEYPGAAPLKELLGLGRDSQVLLINSEGNTDPDYFRSVVWEGVEPVPTAYRWDSFSGQAGM